MFLKNHVVHAIMICNIAIKFNQIYYLDVVIYSEKFLHIMLSA